MWVVKGTPSGTMFLGEMRFRLIKAGLDEDLGVSSQKGLALVGKAVRLPLQPT